ncbi:MAG: hypothetical protein RBS39_11665 [Phycisphaerales bacterium]|jgi:hypothetical protein|nr:hypothetical protein [Phycisphaerales bacterium]
MAEFHARIPGESLHEQATRLAATIAELGVTRLELHEPSGMIRDLRARAANLPALLLTLAEESDESPVEADSPSPSPAPSGAGGGPGWGQSTPLLRVPNLGVTISIAPTSLVWSARDPARAKFFDDHLISTRV